MTVLHSNPVCYYLWTPYTDQEEEGKFLSINDGELISESLPWNAAEEPSSQANHVAVYIRANRSQPTLFSVDESHDNCAVCNISKVRDKLDIRSSSSTVLLQRAVFTLWGACRHSHLGSIQPQKSRLEIQFLENIFFLSHSGDQFQYIGVGSVSIW